MKILCICLSATIQRTLSFENFTAQKVNRAVSFIENASGKAINTARVLNQLHNNSSIVFCPVGRENKRYFSKLAKKDKINLVSVPVPGKTRSCWTLLSKNGDTTEVVCDEPALSLSASTIKKIEGRILKKISKCVKICDAVILAGSTPKIFSTDLCARICKIVKNKNKTLLVDYIGPQLHETLKKIIPDFIKINREEFISSFSDSRNNSDFDSLLEKTVSKLNTTFIITDGSNPTICRTTNDVFSAPVEPVQPVNTTACGDSFNAGFMKYFLCNKSIKECIFEGNRVATLNAQTLIPGSIEF